MTTRWQKIALGTVLVVLLVYLGFRAYREANPPDVSVVVQTPSPSPSAEVAVVASQSASPNPLPPKTATPAATPTAPATALSAINARRASAGAGALSSNAVLQSEAQRHAADMAARGFFDHTSPEGVTFVQRMAATSYPSVAASENIGLTSTMSTTDVVEQWMNSAGHRANMLDASMRAVGIGTATGTYQGMTVLYMVAIFGAER